MPISRPFRTLGFLPFCPESNPKTAFGKGNPPQQMAITNSSIDTTEKSMRFYWLLERLVVTIQRTGPFGDSTTATTELFLANAPSESNGYTLDSITEPHKRVCLTNILTNSEGFTDPQVAYFISFLNGQETNIYFEATLNGGALNGTDEWGFFGLTTVSEDWGYVFSPTVTYYDTTIPITFDQFTLYAKYVRPDASFTFDSITVEDYSFYEIESE